MDLKFKLREWLTINESAQFLSVSTGEEFSWGDVVALLVEGTLPAYWTLQHQPAQAVVPFTILHNFWAPDPYVKALEKVAQEFEISAGSQEKGLSQRAVHSVLAASDGTIPKETKCDGYLDGPFEIQFWYSSVIPDYLRSLTTDEGGDLIALDGQLVRDQEGKFWQLLDWAPGGEPGESHWYYPSDKIPSLKQLTLRRIDLEALLKPEETGGGRPGYGAPMPPHWSAQLQTLIRIANEYWQNADPDESDTHPSQKEIANILRKRGFESERLAKSGAAIIKPAWANKNQ